MAEEQWLILNIAHVLREGFEVFISDPQPDNIWEPSFIVISLQKTKIKKHKIYLLSSWPDCKLQVWEGTTLFPSKPAGVLW